MKNLFLLFLSVCFFTALQAQEATVTKFGVEGKYVVISYDLSGDPTTKYSVEILFSTDNQSTWNKCATVMGDTKAVLPGGAKKVFWDWASDVKGLATVTFKANATADTPVSTYQAAATQAISSQLYENQEDNNTYTEDDTDSRLRKRYKGYADLSVFLPGGGATFETTHGIQFYDIRGKTKNIFLGVGAIAGSIVEQESIDDGFDYSWTQTSIFGCYFQARETYNNTGKIRPFILASVGLTLYSISSYDYINHNYYYHEIDGDGGITNYAEIALGLGIFPKAHKKFEISPRVGLQVANELAIKVGVGFGF